MSISSSMSSALSGLAVAARSAELVSSNIANALTEGYVRRELQIGARVLGQGGAGVQINGVSRDIDRVLTGDRRIASATASDRSIRADFLNAVERVIGSPDDGGSLSGRIAAFDAALLSAASQPESTALLGSVLDTARSLTQTLGRISGTIQDARRDADSGIASDVADVNSALEGISRLNGQIVSVGQYGRDTSALQDQRQVLIDRVSKIVPVREILHDHGRIALYTAGGAVLLDGPPVKLAFSPTPTITEDMTLASGALSGLTVNGRPVRTDSFGQFSGGTLGAQFAVRDTLAQEAQAQLDGVARDVLDRFADPALDATRAPGAAGLFTDQGAAFTGVDNVGLAGRLRVNAAVDPLAGGAVWRLRDGLGAAGPGLSGNGSLLNAMNDALSATRPSPSTAFDPGNRTLSGLAGQLTSGLATRRLAAEAESSFAASHVTALVGLEQSAGVDTDRELQDLLLIEKAYAANARVIQTIDSMLSVMLEI